MPRRRGLHVRQAGKTVLKILAAVSAETRPFSLLTAESIMLGVRHEKEGKLRVTYAGWDDAKVILDAQLLQFGKSQPKTPWRPVRRPLFSQPRASCSACVTKKRASCASPMPAGTTP